MARIYISSTFEDLRSHRRAVYDELSDLGHDVGAMEDYVAASRRPLEVCLEDIRGCGIFIGIYGGRYGSIPEHANPDRLSFVELELREAVEHSKDIRGFLSQVDTPDPLESSEQRSKRARLRAFINDKYLTKQFTSPVSLAVRVKEALKSPEDKIGRLLGYLPNREQQRTALCDGLKQVPKAPQIGVIVGVLEGLTSQGHRQLVEVVRDYDLPREKVGSLTILWIKWPAEELDLEELRQRVIPQLAKDGLPLAETVGPEATAAARNAVPGPVIVVCTLDASRLAGRRRKTIELFFQFWRDWPVGNRRHPFLALLCVHYRHSNSKNVFRRAFWEVRNYLVRKAVRAAVDDDLQLDELDDVLEQFALDWVELPEIRSVVGHRDLNASVLRIYKKEKADALPMTTLAEKLQGLLKKTLSTRGIG